MHFKNTCDFWFSGKGIGLLLLLFFIGRAALLYFFPFPVLYDEAQYWHWAQTPTWGYFSKPPMVAWVIALTTAIGGDSSFFVKIGSMTAHTVTGFFVYLTARALFSPRVGGGAMLIFMLAPAVTYSSMLITTDPFLLCFWSMAIYFFWNAIQAPAETRWYGLGLSMGLGLLSKYTTVFFIVSAVLYLFLLRRDMFKQRGFYSALGIALIIYLPNFLWNKEHAFISYQHTIDNANLNAPLFNKDSFLEFMGGQFGILGPVFFVVFLYLLFHLRSEITDKKQEKSASVALIFLWFFTLPLFVFMSAQAFLSKANANWAGPAYIGASILIAEFLLRKKRIRWLKGGLILNAIALLLLCAIPFIHTIRTEALHPKTWDVFAQKIKDIRARYPQDKLLFDERKMLTPFLYYLRPLPEGTFFKWNPHHARRDHYDLTASLENDQKGEHFLSISRYELSDSMRRSFGVTHEVARWTINFNGIIREVKVYHLENFKGYQ